MSLADVSSYALGTKTHGPFSTRFAPVCVSLTNMYSCALRLVRASPICFERFASFEYLIKRGEEMKPAQW